MTENKGKNESVTKTQCGTYSARMRYVIGWTQLQYKLKKTVFLNTPFSADQIM